MRSNGLLFYDTIDIPMPFTGGNATQSVRNNRRAMSRTIFDDITAAMETYIPSGSSQPAWEVWDDVPSETAPYDRVYRSIGDQSFGSGSGDTRAFIRVRLCRVADDVDGTDDVFTIDACQDWSNLTHAAANYCSGTLLYFIGDELGPVSGAQYWVKLNEYEVSAVFFQSGNEGNATTTGAGVVVRTHIDPTNRGIAFSTAGVASGSDVVIPIDRNLVNAAPYGALRVGQPVWIFNLTPSGSALVNDPVLVSTATITQVTASSITVDLLPNNHASGAVVGLDPIPTYSHVTTPGGFGDTSFRFSVFFATDGNAQYIDDYSLLYYPEPTANGISSCGAANATASFGDYVGCRSVCAETGSGDHRGTMQHFGFWSTPGTDSGSIAQAVSFPGANGSLIKDNYDTDRLWWVFPSIAWAGQLNNDSRHGLFMTALGPGAFIFP